MPVAGRLRRTGGTMSRMLKFPRSALARAAIVLLALPVLIWAGRFAMAQSLTLSGQDERSVRVCRSIIAVINPATSDLDVTSTLRIGEANAIAISYVSRPATGLPRSRKLVCSFKDQGGTFNKTRELVNVVADGAQLGPARLRFLQRYWIGSREADEAAGRLAQQKRR